MDREILACSATDKFCLTSDSINLVAASVVCIFDQDFNREFHTSFNNAR